jgi:alkylation response protein AidB-like acyl-CoA dehydrogenase
MLLTQKAFAEGGRAMVYFGALISDGMINPDKKVRDRVEDDLGLLTPILKGFLTETSLEACSHGMQIWGGHGYIRDNSMEQIYRDARISTLYEGWQLLLVAF